MRHFVVLAALVLAVCFLAPSHAHRSYGGYGYGRRPGYGGGGFNPGFADGNGFADVDNIRVNRGFEETAANGFGGLGGIGVGVLGGEVAGGFGGADGGLGGRPSDGQGDCKYWCLKKYKAEYTCCSPL